MKIGFIGIGVMGSRIVEQLLRAGYEVFVYSRTGQKAKPLVQLGAKQMGNIGELAANVDVLCTCLSMPSDVEEVYLGEDGVMAHAKQSTIFVDFTTVGVDTSHLIFAKAADKGFHYLDAPVSGGPEGIENQTLTIMVGGEREIFTKAEAMLRVFGGTVEYLGKSGSGTIAKLMNQYLVAVHSLAASEVMVTGAAYGLESEQLFNLLKVSYGDSRMLRRHMEHYVLDRNFEPGGAMKYLHKDVKLANELTEKLPIDSFSGKLAEQSLAQAIADGFGDHDMSAVIQPLEKKCGIVVKRSK